MCFSVDNRPKQRYLLSLSVFFLAVTAGVMPVLPGCGQSGTISGSVKLGPNCPVMQNPPDPQCADKPYSAALELTSADQSRVVKEFSSDDQGRFIMDVAPGDYAIRSAAGTHTPPICSSRGSFTVTGLQTTEVTVYCDTGIR